MSEFVDLCAAVAADVVLARDENAVTLEDLAQLALVVAVLFSLAVVVAQLALVGQTAAKLELHLVLDQAALALDPLR